MSTFELIIVKSVYLKKSGSNLDYLIIIDHDVMNVENVKMRLGCTSSRRFYVISPRRDSAADMKLKIQSSKEKMNQGVEIEKAVLLV